MVWYDQYRFKEEDIWWGVEHEDWKTMDPKRRAPGAAIWPAQDLVELAGVFIPEDTITLVNTEWAHHIKLGDEDRWCFSIRPEYLEGDVQYGFDHYAEVLDGYIR